MAKKKAAAPPLPRFSADEESILVFALRYALGRMSTAPSVVVGRLKEVWDSLTESTQQSIIREVEEAFTRDDMHRRRHPEVEDETNTRPLGWDCDRATWQELRALWQIPPGGQRTIYHGSNQ